MTRQNLRQMPAFKIRHDVLANGIERRRIDRIVNLKRMLAGSIVVLMLLVSSMAAACDLSCGFAKARADCHSVRMNTLESAAADMEMSDTGMSGMAMPPESSATIPDQGAASFTFHIEMHDALIGEMGPCERQSCNEYGAYISKSTRHDASQFRAALTVVSLPRMALLQTSFYDLRDGVATFSPGDGVPLRMTLRI
jgi:hypothetical protein